MGLGIFRPPRRLGSEPVGGSRSCRLCFRRVEAVIVRRRQELTKTVTFGRLADDEK
jgi:hypothetical protein